MWLTRTVQPAARQHRCHQPLGPLSAIIRAPRETVFDVIAAPYLGKTPRAMAEALRVVERGSDLVVADHFTPLLGGRLVATTRETVRFESPGRVAFQLLSGPVAMVEEEYLLTDSGDGGTSFLYRGVLGSDLPVLGGWWAARNASAWNAAVRHSVRQITAEAERRAGLGSR